ncbi:hypothetical protein F5J12DRAFT_942414 [Pisolithus orientalis]|uniref:uncharacterized protein n=1 Tax=Pisolithus orientalis TaxID=936130 RepID=UPI00222568EF|nr:uncharacterized protein F5J12DRAFT_942414 [Pisolithus orientalis]KAI6004359.1 hypothetical protein F5J12DRAFT_942414 [Pisolithus orientalis]
MDDSIEIVVGFMCEVEVLMQVQKDKYKDNPIIPDRLDLVKEEEQVTHHIHLEEELQADIDILKFDPNYVENEEKYKAIKAEILGEGSNDESSPEESSEEEEKEAVHKLLKIQSKEGEEIELINMIIECCSQEHSYSTFYGLVGERRPAKVTVRAWLRAQMARVTTGHMDMTGNTLGNLVATTCKTSTVKAHAPHHLPLAYMNIHIVSLCDMRSSGVVAEGNDMAERARWCGCGSAVVQPQKVMTQSNGCGGMVAEGNDMVERAW